jgi:adenosylhomocysteine nucleosidase
MVEPPTAAGSGLACVCGLAAEARIARGAGFSAAVGAGDRRRTAALAAAAAARAQCLVSFGIAGGVSPELRPGDLVLSDEIVAEDGCWRGGEAWRRRLAAIARAIGAARGPILGANAILATRTDKKEAQTTYGARAADLESDLVARAAAAAGIPFAALRAIADPYERDLPAAALVPLAADGRPDFARILVSVLRRPRQVAALVGLGRELRQALAALREAAPALGSLLASG